MYEFILNRFASIERDGAEILSVEDLAAWPPGDVVALKRLGLVKKASPARIVECPGCEEACLMPVNVYPAQDGRPARIFIACDKREDTGRILIDPADLMQWQIDISRFASLLGSALGTGHIPDEIISQQAYYIGALTINQKRRSAIFIVNEEVFNSALESDFFRRYAHPFFLVAAGLHFPHETNHDQAILSLRQLIVLLDDNSLSFDWAIMEHLMSEEDSRQAEGTAADSVYAAEENIFRLEMEFWRVCFRGKVYSIKNSVGMQYITHLMKRAYDDEPEIHVSDLYYIVHKKSHVENKSLSRMTIEQLSELGLNVSGFGEGLDVITPDGKKRVHNQLIELEELIAEADEESNTGEVLRLRESKEALEDYVKKSYGLGGRTRKDSEPNERVRKSVSKAIIYALNKIGKNDDPPNEFSLYLDNHLNTASFCSFRKDPNISWEVMKK